MKELLSNELNYLWNIRYGYTPTNNFDITDAISYVENNEKVFFSVCIHLNMDDPNKPKWSAAVVKNNNLLYQNSGYTSKSMAYSEALLMYFKLFKN